MRKKQRLTYYDHGLRIISGQWKGRVFPILKLAGLRPTPERIRETLFNWLSSYIVNARVLDCFSGSGALAMEALSRRAYSATLLECSQSVVHQLRKNLSLLDVDDSLVIHSDTLLWLQKKAKEPFDIVFLDPPFYKDMISHCYLLLNSNGYLHEKTVIYIEAESSCNVRHMCCSWSLLKERKTKTIGYSLWSVSALK